MKNIEFKPRKRLILELKCFTPLNTIIEFLKKTLPYFLLSVPQKNNTLHFWILTKKIQMLIFF